MDPPGNQRQDLVGKWEGGCKLGMAREGCEYGLAVDIQVLAVDIQVLDVDIQVLGMALDAGKLV